MLIPRMQNGAVAVFSHWAPVPSYEAVRFPVEPAQRAVTMIAGCNPKSVISIFIYGRDWTLFDAVNKILPIIFESVKGLARMIEPVEAAVPGTHPQYRFVINQQRRNVVVADG